MAAIRPLHSTISVLCFFHSFPAGQAGHREATAGARRQLDQRPPCVHLWPSELQPCGGVVLPPHQGWAAHSRPWKRHGGGPKATLYMATCTSQLMVAVVFRDYCACSPVQYQLASSLARAAALGSSQRGCFLQTTKSWVAPSWSLAAAWNVAITSAQYSVHGKSLGSTSDHQAEQLHFRYLKKQPLPVGDSCCRKQKCLSDRGVSWGPDASNRLSQLWMSGC